MAVRKRPKWPTTPAAAAAVDAGLADAAPVAESPDAAAVADAVEVAADDTTMDEANELPRRKRRRPMKPLTQIFRAKSEGRRAKSEGRRAKGEGRRTMTSSQRK